MRFAVRSLLVFVFAFLLLLTLFKPALAKSDSGTNYQPTTTSPSFNNQTLHINAQSVLIELSSAVVCQLIGKDIVNKSSDCLGLDPRTGKIGYMKTQGVVGFMTQMITVLYTPPTHTSEYFRYLAGNFGIAKPVLAANPTPGGVGFNSLLTPFGTIWQTFRNLAYLVFVIAFLIVGVGIMLRIRIDPRTVMTIQNMLPKIIIGLILITFSFAIAGFIIDFMWVAIILVINVLSTIPITDQAGHTHTIMNSISQDSYQNPFQLVNVLGGIMGIATNGGVQVGALINQSMNPSNLSTVIQLPQSTSSGGGWNCDWWNIGCHIGTVLSVVGGVFSATIGGIVNNIIGILLGIIVGALAFMIIIVAVIWALFKIWLALIKAYIFTLADIIFAPFWILAGLIPGSTIGFGGWLRDMLSNLSVFPVTIAMFLLAKLLMDAVTGISTVYMPPLISGVSGSFGAIIALGILLSAPSVLDMTKAFFKAPKINLGPVEKGIAAGGAVIMAGGKRTWGSMYYKDKSGNMQGAAYYARLKTQQALFTNAPKVGGWVANTPPAKGLKWAGDTTVGKGVRTVVAAPVNVVAGGVNKVKETRVGKFVSTMTTAPANYPKDPASEWKEKPEDPTKQTPLP